GSRPTPDDSINMRNKLIELRDQIDSIDKSAVNLLEKRMKIVKKIGLLKKKNNLPVFDRSRWQKIIKSKKGFLKKIWQIINEESLKIEREI
ncbi:chorismate mutase, partial [Patescibacteria group bacterium]|nr:chorismate mutase [Patescibacteria group bacterium]